MFLLTRMFSWPSHCLEDFLRILRTSSFMWLAMADFPITFRSMLLLQAKQNALFEFLSSFRSHDLQASFPSHFSLQLHLPGIVTFN